MKKVKVICNRCKKSEKEQTHWATIHYKDTFGNNDGAGAFTDETDEIYDLCVQCKQKFYEWLKQGEKNG